MNATTTVFAVVAAAAVFSLAMAPIGYAYAAPATAPVAADGEDGEHDGEYSGEGGTCPFKNRQGASAPSAWQGL